MRVKHPEIKFLTFSIFRIGVTPAAHVELNCQIVSLPHGPRVPAIGILNSERHKYVKWARTG